jgi:hypothetical protein
MPYNQFDYRTNPDDVPGANEEAKDWTTDRDQTRLAWGDELMAALNEGPVMVHTDYGDVPDGMPRAGIAIYESFWNSEYNGGYVSIPQANESLEGGHSLLAVGYDRDMVGPDRTQGYFIFWGSWGDLICAKGDHYIPIEYHKYVGDDSDIWQQFDQVPGPGPGPQPNCGESYTKCVNSALKITDFWQMIMAVVMCVINYWICAFGLKAFRSAIQKKKTTQKTMLTNGGTKVRVTVTITEQKKT